MGMQVDEANLKASAVSQAEDLKKEMAEVRDVNIL
jgi:hypothetical protein